MPPAPSTALELYVVPYIFLPIPTSLSRALFVEKKNFVEEYKTRRRLFIITNVLKNSSKWMNL